MEFNPIKCESLTVTRKRSPVIYHYSLHGLTLNRVKSTKYLGITITSDLNCNKHIGQITGKANQALGFVKRNIKTRSRKVKTLAYKALVRPRLEYCASVWAPHTQSADHRLEMVQRRAARYVLRRYHNTSSVSDMLVMLDWPTLAQRRVCLRLTLLYKITYQVVAIPPHLYMTPHTTRTRTHTLSYLPYRCNTNQFKYSFFPHTIPLWNSLPSPIVSASSNNVFKAAVNQHVCSLSPLSP